MQTYRIEKISDLLAVPHERREACLKELLLVLDMYELAVATDEPDYFGPLTWTDDGNPSATMLDAEGDEWLRLDVSVATQAKEQ